jgi:hypothetical protein
MTFKSKMYGQMSWRPDRCAISAVSPRGFTVVVTEIIASDVSVVNSVLEAVDHLCC